MARKQEDDSYTIQKAVKASLFGIVVIALSNYFWPGLIPFGTFEFWESTDGPAQWLGASWPIFVWGFGVNLYVGLRNMPSRYESFMQSTLHRLMAIRVTAFDIYFGGLFRSVFAGVVEEICFRWLIFLSAMPGIVFVNWLFFGWAGLGITEWLHLHLAGPLADFTTGAICTTTCSTRKASTWV